MCRSYCIVVVIIIIIIIQIYGWVSEICETLEFSVHSTVPDTSLVFNIWTFTPPPETLSQIALILFLLYKLSLTSEIADSHNFYASEI